MSHVVNQRMGKLQSMCLDGKLDAPIPRVVSVVSPHIAGARIDWIVTADPHL
jgi:hypothetical protein